MATRWSVTVDCAVPAVVARFWATALGYESRYRLEVCEWEGRPDHYYMLDPEGNEFCVR